MNDGCEQPGDVRRSRLGNYFFWHRVKGDCPGESEPHRQAKKELADRARRNGCEAEKERYVPSLKEGGERAFIDVCITSRAGRPWALEVQRSGQTLDETNRRSAKLNGLGYDVVWIFFKPLRQGQLKDKPGAMHLFYVDDGRQRLARRTSGTDETLQIATDAFVKSLCSDRLLWEGNAVVSHRAAGEATIQSFTCGCGEVSHWPTKAPPRLDLLVCGTVVNRKGKCPEFDWPGFLKAHPQIVPEGLRLCKIIPKQTRGWWFRCGVQHCDRKDGWIHPTRVPVRDSQGNVRGPSREPLRMDTKILISEPLGENEVAAIGHWCGLGDRMCVDEWSRQVRRGAGSLPVAHRLVETRMRQTTLF